MAASATMQTVPTKTRFSEKLARAIDARWRGSQAELAARIGVSRQSLNQYISDSPSTPKTPAIFALAEALKVSLPWLLDEDDKRLEPVANEEADLSEVKDEVILAELKKRLGVTALQLEDLIDRSESYPWESIAAWLLSRFMPPTPKSEFVLAGLQLFKDIEPKAARFRLIGVLTASPGGFITAWDEGTPIPIKLATLIERLDALRDRHPGVLAISYYLHYFDEEWCAGMYGKKELKPTPDWDDRRAWLMAQVVTHDDLNGEPAYEPIRARLREMNYIDAEGKPRDYGYSKTGMGDFDLPEPGWDN